MTSALPLSERLVPDLRESLTHEAGSIWLFQHAGVLCAMKAIFFHKKSLRSGSLPANKALKEALALIPGRAQAGGL